MKQKIQPIRGTRDVWGKDLRQQSRITEQATAMLELYGYQPINTPIFEKSEVFLRTLGETSDVVTKETYTFIDRDKTSITLRPELTAGMMRALLSNNLTQTLPHKLYTVGPAFRHERPQESRYRQFHQIDCEHFGAAHPLTDIEMIHMSYELLRKLGISSGVTLEINSLGDSESRARYNESLLRFLWQHQADLSPESQKRLEKNPLRILDSKSSDDQKILAGAPTIADFYNPNSQEHWQSVLKGLDELSVPYLISDKLVRGLDYYSHTVFEFTTTMIGENGTKIAVLSGGRFDKLSEMMGGPSIPSIGFGAGLERMAKLQQALGISTQDVPFIYMLAITSGAQIIALQLAEHLRQSQLVVVQDFSSNLAKGLKRANNTGANFTLILGEDELTIGKIKVKDMESGHETLCPFSELTQTMVERLVL